MQESDPWSDVLARWLLLLSIVDQRKSYIYEDIYKELEAIAVNDKHFQDAFTIWNELSVDPKERQVYEVRLKQLLDEEAIVNEVKWRIEDAEKRGMELGMEKGTMQVARKMLEKHMSVEEVAELTGLSIESTQEIKTELGL